MSLGLELHVEKGSFKNEAGVDVVYNRYYVIMTNQYSGEEEKFYLQAKDNTKFALASLVKKLEKK